MLKRHKNTPPPAGGGVFYIPYGSALRRTDALSDMDDKILNIGHNGLDRQASRSRSLFTANSEMSTE